MRGGIYNGKFISILAITCRLIFMPNRKIGFLQGKKKCYFKLNH